MSALGSVFLGDVQRHRVVPPSSPPAVTPSPSMGAAPSEEVLESVDGTESPAKTAASLPDHAPVTIDPALALELRLRWLEALLLGVRQDARDRKPRPSELKPGETLVQLAADVQRRLTAVVDSNDGLKKFMHQYDQHAQWLTPAFAHSAGMPVDEEQQQQQQQQQQYMSPDALEALLSEMESDIRAADRDVREMALLEHKGVLSAGKLADHEALRPRLRALLVAQEQDVRLATALERRIAALVERHATHVDTLSELFVAWDDVLTETESKVRMLERNKEEKQRLGYV